MIQVYAAFGSPSAGWGPDFRVFNVKQFMDCGVIAWTKLKRFFEGMYCSHSGDRILGYLCRGKIFVRLSSSDVVCNCSYIGLRRLPQAMRSAIGRPLCAQPEGPPPSEQDRCPKSPTQDASHQTPLNSAPLPAAEESSPSGPDTQTESCKRDLLPCSDTQELGLEQLLASLSFGEA